MSFECLDLPLCTVLMLLWNTPILNLKARNHFRNLLVSLNFQNICFFNIFLACIFSFSFFFSFKLQTRFWNLNRGTNCLSFKMHAFRYEYKFHKTWSWKISYHLHWWTDARDKKSCKVSSRDKGGSKSQKSLTQVKHSKPGSHLSLSLLCGHREEVQRDVCITNFLA